MNRPTQSKSRAQGYTLIELLVAVAVLVTLLAVTFNMINKTQTTYRVESDRVDFTQQQREFIDQFTRDMHQAGYPTPATQGQVTGAFTGVQFFSNVRVTMQGDLDGTGPQTVTYAYNAACTCPTCGCLQRTVAGNPPVIAVENVIAPGPQEIFTAYDINGNPTNVFASIRSIRVTFTVQGGVDASRSTPVQNTMTGMARLPNNN